MTARHVSVLLLLAFALSGCRGDLPARSTTCADTAALVLMAQAVPDAQAIPCFDDIPYAFAATTFDVEAETVEVGLSHAVVGPTAVRMTIAQTCRDLEGRPDDLTAAVGEMVEELEQPEAGHVSGRIVQGLGGACLVVMLDMPHADGARALEDLRGSWRLLARHELRERLAAETDGRLDLR